MYVIIIIFSWLVYVFYGILLLIIFCKNKEWMDVETTDP